MFARIGIKTRIVAAYTFVFGLLLVAFAYVTSENVRESELRELDAQLAIFAGKVAEDVAQDVEDGETTEPGEFADFIPEGLEGARVQVWARNGTLTIPDSLLATTQARPSATDEPDEVVANELTIDGLRWRSLWMPVEIDGEYPFVIQAAASQRELESDLANLRWLFIILIPLALLVCGMAAYWLTRLAFRPISAMSEAARQMTLEQLDQRVSVPDPQDEVRELAVTLNQLLSRIETAFATQRQFVADASHELRTPLTVIRTELEFAAKQTDPDMTSQSIAVAIAETERLERLTYQLLALVRFDSGRTQLQREPVRLDDLLIESVKMVKGAADAKRITFSIHMDDAFELLSDPVQLKSAFLNVIENAVKYSVADSEVAVTLSRSDSAPSCIAVMIRDAGPGIPKEEHDLIFRRFYRAKAQRGETNGSGLGLAIANQIILLHGGKISVDSDVNRGARFTIELPHTSEVAQA